MEIIVVKSPSGFVPSSREDWDKIGRIKTGTHMRFEAKQMRNVWFHRKYFALLNLMFDYWSETTPKEQYKDIDVLPEFERFRKDVAIMAGFFRPVFNIRNELRLEAESIAFGNMSEERFEQLYDATINVALQKVLPRGQHTEESLRAAVELVMGFAN